LINCVRKCALSAYIVLLSTGALYAQENGDSDKTLNQQKDAKDVIRSIFRKNSSKDTGKITHSNFSILPSAGYNPSVGFAVGVTSTGGTTFGNPNTTTFSVFNGNAYISTNGLASIEFKHNIFTANNLFNLQGGIQAGKTIALDYGIGTGRKVQGDGSFSINNLPLANNPDILPITYSYLKLNERIYRRLFDHIFAGAGAAFNLYSNIDNTHGIGPNMDTHNYRYSKLYGFNPSGYWGNGLLFNVEYNSRDQPNRPYKGLYTDLVLRVNQQWLGSDKNGMQLKTELRKYWSLSKKNPEHVIAYWLWGNYLLRGEIPYLELPGTGSDAANRIGRAYTIGRFKGTSFFYSEAEYRFPITQDKLLSGVTFVNDESASNQHAIKLFEYWEPGAGVGLRLLFNKYTRSNLCIDYGVGNYGSKGLFLGLNEVF
jgi:hypothetical protein